jgi:hypothetical protein
VSIALRPSMRMGIRRFTRLTNAFSKKWENHWAALCVWFIYINSVGVTVRVRSLDVWAARVCSQKVLFSDRPSP